MNKILSVVSKPGDPDLAAACQKLQANGFERVRQLEVGRAVEFSGAAHPSELAKLLDELAVDWCLHDGQVRVYPVLICDMDSTIIGQECLDELAAIAGSGPEVQTITEAAMAGELEFDQSLLRRVQTLAGQDENILQQCWAQRIRLNPMAKTLIATLNRIGTHTALVSGGFTWFSGRVAKQAGFAEHHANRLEIQNEKLTGKVQGPILNGRAKLAHLHRLSANADDVCAIGDGANDLPMIAAAAMGLAFHAKPILTDAANGRIRHTDLATALFFQGIPSHDWVICD